MTTAVDLLVDLEAVIDETPPSGSWHVSGQEIGR